MKKRNYKKESSAILKAIESDKKALDKAIVAYAKDVEGLKKCIKAYLPIEAKEAKKSSETTSAKLAKVKAALDSALALCSDKLTSLTDSVAAVCDKYNSIVELAKELSPKSVKAATEASVKFEAEYTLKISKLHRGIIDRFCPKATLPEAPAAAEEPETIEEDQPAEAIDTAEVAENVEPAPAFEAKASGATSVSVAPVTIDITPIVERAIAATMEKLTAGMDKKLRAYIQDLKLPEIPASAYQPSAVAEPVGASSTAAVSATAKANSELEAHLLAEESHVLEKLKDMCASVQTVIDGLSDLSMAYMTLAAKQKEIAELQKQTNDMQRYTLREQQGVQVNQKIINKDQAELAGEQALVIEKQKQTADEQKGVIAAQESVRDTQATIIETQAALEGAMREVMQVQKELITTQQAIVAGNAKNQDLQKAIAEKQGEISAAQKEFLSEQKAILREQKALGERQRSAGAKKTAAKKADEKPEAKDAPVEAEPTADEARQE